MMETTRSKTSTFNILHHAVHKKRGDVIKAVFVSGLLSSLKPRVVTSESSKYKGMTAMDMAKDMKLTKIEDSLRSYDATDKEMNRLQQAARLGSTQYVSYILEKHPSWVNRMNYFDEMTPLFWAVTSGNLQTVQLLCQRCGDPHIRVHNSDVILTVATRLGHYDIIKYLSKACHVDVDMSGADGKCPLLIATENCNEAVIKLLVDELGAHIEPSCLCCAATYKQTKIIEYLLAQCTSPVNINSCDKQGKSPLFHAVQNGCFDNVKYLIHMGADLGTKDKRQRNILHAAVEGGYLNLLKYLIHKAKKMHILNELLCHKDKYLGKERCHFVQSHDNNDHPCFHYVEIDRLILTKFKCKSDGVCDTEELRNYGHIITSGFGRCPANETIQEVEFKYDVSKIKLNTADDMTPLYLAILMGKTDMVKLILQQEGQHPAIHMTDSLGATPMHLVCMTGQLEVAKCLLSGGASLDVLDDKNRNPLDVAKLNDNRCMVNYITGREFNFRLVKVTCYRVLNLNRLMKCIVKTKGSYLRYTH